MKRQIRQKAQTTLLAELMQIDMPEPPLSVSFHTGKMRALEQFCQLIQRRGVQGAIRDVALSLERMDPNNKHAKWVLDNYHKYRLVSKCRALMVIPQVESKAA